MTEYIYITTSQNRLDHNFIKEQDSFDAVCEQCEPSPSPSESPEPSPSESPEPSPSESPEPSPSPSPSDSPEPSPSPVCIPECSFFEPGTTGGGCGNPPTIYGEQTISIPSGLTAPVYVELIGGADDLLIIDGEVVDAGQIDNGFGCLVSAGNYAFVLNSPSFTIAAGDTVGGNAGYTYQICFYNVVYS